MHGLPDPMAESRENRRVPNSFPKIVKPRILGRALKIIFIQMMTILTKPISFSDTKFAIYIWKPRELILCCHGRNGIILDSIPIYRAKVLRNEIHLPASREMINQIRNFINMLWNDLWLYKFKICGAFQPVVSSNVNIVTISDFPTESFVQQSFSPYQTSPIRGRFVSQASLNKRRVGEIEVFKKRGHECVRLSDQIPSLLSKHHLIK